MIDKRVYISKKYIYVKENDNYVIKSRRRSINYIVNNDMMKLLKFIYINHGLFLSDIYNMYDIPEDIIEELIRNEILTFQWSKFNPFAKSKLSSMKRLFIQLTAQCNLYCKHCFNASSRENISQLSSDEVYHLIDHAIDCGIYQIDFTGGEIFLYPNLLDILNYLDEKPVITHLFTNLTLLTKEQIDIISNLECVHKIITSLDFYTPEKHDDFRSLKGAFERTVSNIRYLKEKNFENICVNIMVLDDNHEEIEKLINFLKFDLKVDYRVDTIIPQGRAESFISKKIDDKLIENSLVLAKVWNNKDKNSPLVLNKTKEIGRQKFDFCGVGKNMIYITSWGEISLCPSLNSTLSSEFNFGNIKQPYDFLKLERSIVEKYGNLDCDQKNNCEFHELCSGGCRARALLYKGGLNMEDPIMCAYYGKLTKKNLQ
ncbi:MAG TPA: radical SAM protein [Thermoanaerobacter sp.]|nr:radical SAM protein [Thermoanaerobacter sp.]